MAISDDRRHKFEALSVDEMTRWLETVIGRYLEANPGSDIFAPFELFMGVRESPAADIHWAYSHLSAAAQVKFKAAVAKVIGTLDPRPKYTPIWKFLIELAWHLPAPCVIEAFERRCNSVFLDALCSGDDELFDYLFGYILHTAKSDSGARCIRRLVLSSHFNAVDSRRTLLRLCEIDPDSWVACFALLRDHLHQFFTRVRKRKDMERMNASQDALATDILDAIGFDRFSDQCSQLFFTRDGGTELPGDNWFYLALIERTKLVINLKDSHGACLALRERPNYKRYLAKEQLDTQVNADHRGQANAEADIKLKWKDRPKTLPDLLQYSKDLAKKPLGTLTSGQVPLKQAA